MQNTKTKTKPVRPRTDYERGKQKINEDEGS